jgi:hypothetical protein
VQESGTGGGSPRRRVDIAEKVDRAAAREFQRIALLSLSYTNLGSALRSAGEREEAWLTKLQNAPELLAGGLNAFRSLLGNDQALLNPR